MTEESFGDQLRRAINESGMSRYAIAKATGTSQATLSRFMNGERGLTIGVINKVCALLGLRLAKTKRAKK